MQLKLDTDSNHEYRMEEVISTIIPKKYVLYFRFFVQVTSVANALLNAIEIVDNIQQLKQMFIKQSMYPLLIFLFSFITLVLFSNYVIPQLLRSFNELEPGFIIYVVYFIQWLCIGGIGLFFVFIICCMVLAHKMNDDEQLYKKWFSKLSVLKEFHSYYFSMFYNVLSLKGMSSMDSLMCMEEVFRKSIIVHLIREIRYELHKGNEFISIIEGSNLLSITCKQYFMLGMLNQSLTSDLKNYLEMQKDIWIKQIKTISIIIQGVSYMFVGILMICVYQIMLLPLEMFGNM